jgi:hypothetical protein
MANYPKELTDLLQQYMTDGVMTEKERAVLLRKAESLGVDKDEFDLYIDAEEQKYDQKIDAAKRQAKGKLCPFCEASVPMFTDKCPECGCHITPQVTKELETIIEALEDALVKFKSAESYERSKAEVERYVRKARMYYSNNRKVQLLLEDVKNESLLAEKRYKSATRLEMVKKTLSNPWVCAVIAIFLGIFFALILEDDDAAACAFIVGFGVAVYIALFKVVTDLHNRRF